VIFTKQEERAMDTRLLASIPFDSKYKMSFAAIKDARDQSIVRIFGKGAPDFILKHCTTFLNEDGSKSNLSEEQKDKIVNDILKNNFAKRSYRTILTAYRDLPAREFFELLESINDKSVEEKIDIFGKGLTMVALFGLQDPLKDGVVEAIRTCQRAGVTVRMVTGDNLDTATAIALEAGILSSEKYNPDALEANQQYTCMTGKQFRELIKLRPIKNSEGVVVKEVLEDANLFRTID
jgi:magnesium-transporting ATPase (P-type)